MSTQDNHFSEKKNGNVWVFQTKRLGFMSTKGNHSLVRLIYCSLIRPPYVF